MLAQAFPSFSASEKQLETTTKKLPRTGKYLPHSGCKMLLKIRKWLTVAGAFMFVLSVTYTAVTIDANLKKEAVKKFNNRQKELNQVKGGVNDPDGGGGLVAIGSSITITTAATTGPATPVRSTQPLPPIKVTDSSGSQLSRCKVWIQASQALLSDDFWRCSVESALANTIIDLNSNPLDDYNDITNRHSVCLISDRFAQPGLNLSSAQSSWIWSLQDKFGKDRLMITAPDYVSVFAGTLFEEVYVNSEDMSFLGAALVWSLMWKYGGLLVHQDTLLLTNLKSYYNFVVMNSSGNASTLALLQLESQHSLSSNALHHLMEQLQRRSSYVNFFHPLGPGAGNKNKNSGKPMMAKLKPLTEKDWTQEVETFCGKKMDKAMAGKFCHDTEVVDSESVPRISDKKTLKTWIRNVANSPYTARTLAVQIDLNPYDKNSILQDRHVRRWLRAVCPIMFNMQQ